VVLTGGDVGHVRVPVTATGVLLMAVVPFPNCPLLLSPQESVPLWRPARRCGRVATSLVIRLSAAKDLSPRSRGLRL
jgi:hypothetical protein